MGARDYALVVLALLGGCAQSALKGEPNDPPGANDGGADGDSDGPDASGTDPDAGRDAGGGGAEFDASDARDASHTLDASDSVDARAQDGGDEGDASVEVPPDAARPDAGCPDSDGDGTDDCEELADDDPWTDPTVFNGVRVRWKGQCSSVGSCNENNTRDKVDDCMSGSVREELNQHAGWDWDDPPDNICNDGYGFLPNWSECGSSWQAQWSGFINLESAGHHCFAITGNSNEGCGAVFFDAEGSPAQSGGAPRCYDVAAGVYPIMWHYTMDNGSRSSLHVVYCRDAAADCTPTEVLPAALLRVSYP